MAPVEPGVLVAGIDPVATDAVATAVQGFDPTAQSPSVPFHRGDNYLNLAHELGLGTNRLEEIEVGERIMLGTYRSAKRGTWLRNRAEKVRVVCP